jgi:hypothetical protein
MFFYRKSAFAKPESGGHAVSLAARAGVTKRFEVKVLRLGGEKRA